jgi:hypothetical protein
MKVIGQTIPDLHRAIVGAGIAEYLADFHFSGLACN